MDEKLFEQYFQILAYKRNKLANALDDPAAKNVKRSIVEKYSDQAHFIYELIQNADDAGATKVRFYLEKDRLFFIHNGKRHFSLTNPDTEGEDGDKGVLGDLNAITSYAHSSKEGDSNKIGKFGIGFKAVFQYTDKPTIYDIDMAFSLVREIVPEKVENDCPLRNPDETAFEFPFTIKSQEDSYKEILEKLSMLVFPMLFLKNISEIYYESEESSGGYTYQIDEEICFDGGVSCQKVKYQFVKKTDEEIVDDIEKRMLKFTSTTDEGFDVSIVYFLNDKNELVPETYTAFCFFPTKEITHLSFAIHAPFLLIDNRESIMAKEKHNLKMIDALADLAANSLVCLKEIGEREQHEYISGNIFEVIPYNDELFYVARRNDQISFEPIFYKIKVKFQTAEIIPAGNNEYIRMEHAYWSPKAKFMNLLSDTQLRQLTGDVKACWVTCRLPSKGSQDIFQKYISEIVSRIYYPINLIEKIDEQFTEKQTQKWLVELYKYLMTSRELLQTAKTLPILLDQNKNAVAAYDEDGEPAVFLSSEDDEDIQYTVVYPPMVKNVDVRDFLQQLDVHRPKLRDEIYNHILPMYEKNISLDPSKHWGKFLTYYKESYGRERERFISTISLYKIFFYQEDGRNCCASKDDIHKYSINLEKYFDGIKTVKYYDYKKINRIAVSTHTLNILEEFLKDFGLDDALPKIVEYWYSLEEGLRKNLQYFDKDSPTWYEKRIEGLQENVEKIQNENDIPRAFLVWEILVELYQKKFMHCNMSEALKGRATYQWGRSGKRRGSDFESTDVKTLKSAKWLVNNDGELVSASDVFVEDLNKSYRLDSPAAKALLDFLGVGKNILSDLPPNMRKEFELYRKLKSEFTEDELLEMLANKKKEKAQKQSIEVQEKESTVGASEEVQPEQPDAQSTKNVPEDEEQSVQEEVIDEGISSLTRKISENASRNLKEKREQAEKHRDREDIPFESDERKSYSKDIIEDNDIELPDEDDYIKAPVDYQKKIEREMEKATEQVERIRQMEELSQKAEKAAKYSFGWFKALLDMEANISDTGNNNREVSIKFGRAERESGTDKTLVLRNPSQHIPMFMEEISNVKVEFTLHDGQSKNATIDAMSVKGYTLKVKLRSADEIKGIEFTNVRECKISAQSPSFLLNELIKSFKELGFSDDFDMKGGLTEKIQFIFGPPGTGKTTYLAGEVIVPFMTENNKVLVLTPTNKAADVIAKRVFDMSKDKAGCREWLIRFGSTNDESLEREGIFKDKTVNIKNLEKYTVVSTIARFAYDYFIESSGGFRYLREMEWDYVIFDEASMIHLPSIVFPLYKLKPNGFVVAGDPLQIAPIAQVESWKDENIYKLTGLSSFSSPKTEPYAYEVVQLKKQYRSIPLVGEIYSRFAYDGLLEHNRQDGDMRRLNIEETLPLKNLNIVKFPVSRYEGIYRAKRLQGKSPYHIYAALFAVEFSRYIADLLADNNGDEHFSIGVIAPYKTEASLIDKLLAQQDFPSSISIQAGTIHGFQGDECDIVLCVLNPPPKISARPDMFLNKQNIINVAISRARDYLVIIMPDDNTPGMENLKYVTYLTNLMKQNRCAEFSTRSLEQIMFPSATYIEDNTFTTSHQDVNVYGLPEKHYEVRSEDTALDVQIHKDAVSQSGNAEKTDVELTELTGEGRMFDMPAETIAEGNVVGSTEDVKQKSIDSMDTVEQFTDESADEAVQEYINLNIEQETDARLYVPGIDIDEAVDSAGWNIQELALAMDIFVRFKTNGESIETLIGELTAQMIRYVRPDDEAESIKMELIYKMGVFNRLAQGLGMDEAGASELEYEIWQIYKGNPLMYEELKDEALEGFRT
ncbi:sacsin N-terminal ATP-binding-like domain-containing protein [Selenomonas ruminantium]|uniref:Superfamily I DNA and/or RNA helicase n=1 Tax=Selenomonas ruminantium TaxID=971 RepID=A0A1H3VQF8_SELRU|nr:AAA domain-containing protein [Selenomonas ruminantium]SDZ77043.1 Superfamily I DNA and/or RNA helicase [Selenomonas ruminantium]